jgi:hypothetical protein
LRTTLFALIVLFGIKGYAQGNLNDYKYIIVPTKFESFKKANEHQTSTLIKHLFTKKGFLAVYDNQLPQDLAENRCLGLISDLRDESNMFTTKANIVLTDCNGEEVMATPEARSKIKEFKGAYEEVIRATMKSFNNINYNYQPKAGQEESVTLNFRNDVKKLEERNPKANEIVQKQKKSVVVEEKHKPKNVSPTVVQKATEKEQLYKNVEPVTSDIGPGKAKYTTQDVSEKTEIWYAQELPNGYQLVDSTPKIRMTLLKSSTDNVYMAQSEGKNGMVYQVDDKWIFEYYLDGKLIKEELLIKF